MEKLHCQIVSGKVGGRAKSWKGSVIREKAGWDAGGAWKQPVGAWTALEKPRVPGQILWHIAVSHVRWQVPAFPSIHQGAMIALEGFRGLESAAKPCQWGPLGAPRGP